MRRNKGTRTTQAVKYYIRVIKRTIIIAVYVFILFLIIMAIIWAVPRVWNWALG